MALVNAQKTIQAIFAACEHLKEDNANGLSSQELTDFTRVLNKELGNLCKWTDSAIRNFLRPNSLEDQANCFLYPSNLDLANRVKIFYKDEISDDDVSLGEIDTDLSVDSTKKLVLESITDEELEESVFASENNEFSLNCFKSLSRTFLAEVFLRSFLRFSSEEKESYFEDFNAIFERLCPNDFVRAQMFADAYSEEPKLESRTTVISLMNNAELIIPHKAFLDMVCLDWQAAIKKAQSDDDICDLSVFPELFYQKANLEEDKLFGLACKELASERASSNKNYEQAILQLLSCYDFVTPTQELLHLLETMITQEDRPCGDDLMLKILASFDYEATKDPGDIRFIEDYALATLLDNENTLAQPKTLLLAAETLMQLPTLSQQGIETLGARILAEESRIKDTNFDMVLKKILDKFTDSGFCVEQYFADDQSSLRAKVDQLEKAIGKKQEPPESLLKELALILVPLREMIKTVAAGSFDVFSTVGKQAPSNEELSMRLQAESVCEADELELARKEFINHLTSIVTARDPIVRKKFYYSSKIRHLAQVILSDLGTSTIHFCEEVFSDPSVKAKEAKKYLKAFETLLDFDEFNASLSSYISAYPGRFSPQTRLSERVKETLSSANGFQKTKQFFEFRGVPYLTA